MSPRILTQGIRNYSENTVYHHPEDSKNIRTTSGLQWGTRHTQCFMVFLGLASSYCLRTHLSVAIVSMTENSSFNDAPVLTWDSRMKGTILSSFYWGYIFTLIPAGRLCEIFGPKFLLVLVMLVSGIIMVLTPFAAIYGGFYGMIVTRILLGITQAVYFPAVNVFLSNWAPTEEKGMLFSFVISGCEFGILVTMAMAGALADSQWGWPSVFYVCGGITMLWALVYAYLGANSPQEHSSISEYEKSYILSSISYNSLEKDRLKARWKAIASSVPLYAIAIAHCVNAWIYYTMLFQAPSYIHSVLGLGLKESGFISALMYVSTLIALYVFAVMNYWFNKKKIMSRTALLKSWNTVAQWVPALIICLLAFVEENKALAVALIIAATAINAACHNGFHSNHLDISPNFAGTLMGITVAVSTLSTMSTPLYVGFIVTDPKSVSSWRTVFLTVASLLFVGNLFFIFFATTEVQPWNFPPDTVKSDLEETISKDGGAKKESDRLE